MVASFEASSHLRKLVASLLQFLASETRRVIVIHDSLMASVAQDATNIANIENYTFHSVSAFNFLFLRSKVGSADVESYHVPEAPSLEGCFTDQFMDFIIEQVKFHKLSDGNIYNTTRAILKVLTWS